MRKVNTANLCFLGLLFLLGMTACTTVPPSSPPTSTPWAVRQARLDQIQSWHIKGKIALQTNQDAGSAFVDWKENYGLYTMTLSGPLGASAFTLTGQRNTVLLQSSDGTRYTAKNPEELLSERWGWHLPVSHLHYWIRGLPAPGISASGQFDQYHRYTELTQENWHIAFLHYFNRGQMALPDKIWITSPSLKVKIVIYEWNID